MHRGQSRASPLVEEMLPQALGSLISQRCEFDVEDFAVMIQGDDRNRRQRIQA
jgi:hypothetical protein